MHVLVRLSVACVATMPHHMSCSSGYCVCLRAQARHAFAPAQHSVNKVCHASTSVSTDTLPLLQSMQLALCRQTQEDTINSCFWALRILLLVVVPQTAFKSFSLVCQPINQAPVVCNCASEHGILGSHCLWHVIYARNIRLVCAQRNQ